MPLTDPYVVVVEDASGRWGWRLQSRSHGSVPDPSSGDDFTSADDAESAAVETHAGLAVVRVPTSARDLKAEAAAQEVERVGLRALKAILDSDDGESVHLEDEE